MVSDIALVFTFNVSPHPFFLIGVTHLPEVHRIELPPIFHALSEAGRSATDGTEPPSANATPTVEQIANSTICVVVATDGVWDNWIYEDVGRFMMDASCLNATATHVEGAQKVMTSFMIRNSQFSKRNFGNQADNATGIALYLSLSSNFSA